MPPRPLAVILASADLERLYTGLSLLVSAGAEGRSVRGLATFGALTVLADPALGARALDPLETPHLTAAGRTIFARTLVELREMAGPSVHACAAAIEMTGLSADGLAGVRSTPRFLAEAGDAELTVV